MILAGGAGRRLGGVDKALLPLGGMALLGHAIRRLGRQTGALLLSANGDAARFAAFGVPVVSDGARAGEGPLAGLLAAFDWARTQEGVRDLLTVPVDAPFFPEDLHARLDAARDAAGARASFAAWRGRAHPTVALLALDLAPRLAALFTAGERRLGRALDALGAVAVDFGDLAPDPFLNLNTWDEVREAERRLAARDERTEDEKAADGVKGG